MSEYDYLFPRLGAACGSCGNLPGQGHKLGCISSKNYGHLAMSFFTRLMRILSGKTQKAPVAKDAWPLGEDQRRALVRPRPKAAARRRPSVRLDEMELQGMIAAAMDRPLSEREKSEMRALIAN